VLVVELSCVCYSDSFCSTFARVLASGREEGREKLVLGELRVALSVCLCVMNLWGIAAFCNLPPLYLEETCLCRSASVSFYVKVSRHKTPPNLTQIIWEMVNLNCWYQVLVDGMYDLSYTSSEINITGSHH